MDRWVGFKLINYDPSFILKLLNYDLSLFTKKKKNYDLSSAESELCPDLVYP